MEHVIAKTGLGMAINQTINDLKINNHESEAVKSMLIDIFSKKFADFKNRHSQFVELNPLFAYYVVQNEYPVGQSDIHQYFRCLAYDVKLGNGSLTVSQEEQKRNYTIIEGYSRNEKQKKIIGPKTPIWENKNDGGKKDYRQNYLKFTKPIKRDSEDHQCERYLQMIKKQSIKKLMGV